jgi:hypothetical protein
MFGVLSCNTPLCHKSSNLSKEFFEGTGTADSTLHNKNTFLSTTHTHTHTQYVQKSEIGKKVLFFNKIETFKLIKKETANQ